MKSHRIVISGIAAAGILSFSSCGTHKGEMDSFIDDLMSQMSIEQKIGQLNMLPMPTDIFTGPEVKADIASLIREDNIGAVLNIRGAERVRRLQQFAVDSSSLHIPLLIGLDITNGYTTIMPMALGLAATWNPAAAERAARISAMEATADGIQWTFAPACDVSHDGRWGRMQESFGEDPFLSARFAEAMVRGFQGDGSGQPDQLMACVKHYALYGASFAGLDYTAVDMSRPFMFNYYMEPYRAAVQAGAATVMSSFNEVEGIPSTANSYLLTDVLRRQWGFDGFVVSDYNGVLELPRHGLGDKVTTVGMALNAGMDMDMSSMLYLNHLKECVDSGLVSPAKIDAACRKVLEAKWKAGLFQDPYRFCREQERDSLMCCQAFLDASEEIAEESLVLIKNEDNLLPLDEDADIALIGPFADNVSVLFGRFYANGINSPTVTVAEGLKEAGSGKIMAEPGCNVCHDEKMQDFWQWSRRFRGNYVEWIEDEAAAGRRALDAASRADVIVAAMGEPGLLTGEGASRADISIPDAQKDLLKKLVATGKPVILVLFTGRQIDLSWESENVAAILIAWLPGTKGGKAIADVLYGKSCPSGKLPVSYPRCVGQLPYFYNHTPSGRPWNGRQARNISTYLDCPPDPLFPFGYGLSYTTFGYSSPVATVAGRKAEISVAVTNTGTVEGSETVQLYIRDVRASQARPVKELKGFEKLHLAPGETRTVKFTLTDKDLSFWNADMKFVFEPGDFKAMLGGNSRDVVTASFTMN